MAKVLHVKASPRAESYSARVADAFLDAYRKAHRGDSVELLDLLKADIPPFQAPQSKAKYAVMSGQAPVNEAEAAWESVIRVINDFKGFDKYVLSTPMWNFGIPYRLKQYFDVIVQPGLTFGYSPEKGYTGMVTGRPAMLILASGGTYPPGSPYDFQESYLRCILGFIGFADIKAIHIAGTLMNKPDQIAADCVKAEADARAAAAGF